MIRMSEKGIIRGLGSDKLVSSAVGKQCCDGSQSCLHQLRPCRVGCHPGEVSSCRRGAKTGLAQFNLLIKTRSKRGTIDGLLAKYAVG